MVFEVQLAQAFETLDQQDPAEPLIGDFKVFIDDDIVITAPVHDLALGVFHAAGDDFRR